MFRTELSRDYHVYRVHHERGAVSREEWSPGEGERGKNVEEWKRAGAVRMARRVSP